MLARSLRMLSEVGEPKLVKGVEISFVEEKVSLGVSPKPNPNPDMEKFVTFVGTHVGVWHL